MIRIAVTGPKGKMGRLIAKYAFESEALEISGALAPKGRAYIGEDLGVVCSIGAEMGILVSDDMDEVVKGCDVVVDYTSADVSMDVLEAAARHKKAVVCGSTGFTGAQLDRMNEISKEIPLLYAANTSRLVNLMYRLLEIVTSSVGKEADIEIIEMHDRNKKDAPSGTSKEMGERIAKALEGEIDELAVYGRSGSDARREGSIGYHSIRSCDISSSHTVMFGLAGERLEITHHAHNWNCFAQGACKAAEYIYGKAPGLYGVEEIL